MPEIITIDVGTMSLQASVYNEAGEELFASSYSYSAIYLPEGHVEQEPSDWEKALKHTLGEVGNFVSENEVDIQAFSVTSQRASVIPVDEEGRPLHNTVTWQDKRSADIVEDLLEEISMEEIYQKTGLRANPYFSLPKMIWFKRENPLIYNRTHKLLGVQDYVIYLLTGEYKTDASQAARTMLMDIKTFDWDEDMLEISGIEEEKLCELLPPGSVAGNITDNFSELAGVSKDTPVIMAGGDQQNAALSLNVISQGRAEANTGTGSFIIAHTDEPVFDENQRVLCSASAIPGKWIIEASMFNSGSIYRWFRDEFYDGEVDYNQMNEEAAESPVGAKGVVLIPHFEGSAAPYWNSFAKGLFFNLSLGTKRSDMLRAILEGIALEITSNLALIENIAGNLDMVSVAGGLTRSDLFNQIQADAANKEVVRYKNSEASSLGALMSALVTLEYYDSYEEAFEKIVGTEELLSYQPDRDNHLRYNQVAARKMTLYNALDENDVYERFVDRID
jgi:xylulokinase/glycerol kinase